MGAFTPPLGKKTGLVPRDYKSFPSGYLEAAPSYPQDMIIPRKEWPELRKELRAKKAGLLEMREAFYEWLKSLDQNGFGLCWAFSATKAAMYLRILMGLTPQILSAWYVAGNVVNWQDQGYWGSASLEFIIKNGVPLMEKCSKYKSSAVASDAAENAKENRVTEWWDGYDDPGMNYEIAVSEALRGHPTVCDLNSIGHSMCGIDTLDDDTFVYDNSWNEINQYGPKGLYYGKGRDIRINGLVIPRVIMASEV